MSREKQLFLLIFFGFATIIISLPFLMAFNEALTRLVETNLLYTWIQDNIVPWEARFLGAILLPFGYKYFVADGGIIVNGLYLGLTWNCLGWQSLLLFLVTLLVGLRGRYTRLSALMAILIGFLGIFWLNTLRMLFTVLLAVHFPSIFRIVFHDYLAALTTIIFLFIFWWFAYSFVLEGKGEARLMRVNDGK